MPSAQRVLLASAVVTVVVVAVGVLVSPAPHSAPAEGSAPPAVPERVARASFCDRVPTVAIEDALGGPVTGLASYGPGDTATVTDGVEDIVDEFSCTWARTTAGAVAKAWLFAAPVTADQAAKLALELPKGCSESTGTIGGNGTGDPLSSPAPLLGFGDPSSHALCFGTTEVAPSGTVSALYRGLIGDAWLSCQLTSGGMPSLALRETVELAANRWCAAVADAAAG